MHNPLKRNRAALQLTRGIEKTVAQLVEKLAETSTEVTDDGLADVAAVSAGNNRVVRPTPCTQVLPPPAPSCSMGVSEAQAVEEVEAPNSGCCQSSQGQRLLKARHSGPACCWRQLAVHMSAASSTAAAAAEKDGPDQMP